MISYILGTPQRRSLISKLKQKLNDAQLILDLDSKGPLYSQIQALKDAALNHPSEPILLLQDDADPCPECLEICTKIISHHPDKVVSLFPYDFLDTEVVPFENDIPYYDLGILSGVGTLIPNKWLDDYIAFAECSPRPKEDDKTLQLFCEENQIEIIQTVPALVQHIGDQSIWNPTASIRRTKYLYQPGQQVNWETSEINHLQYHSRKDRMIAESLRRSRAYLESITKK